ncbi:hypothetical protein [Haloarcula argentinensis]|uniref:Uncharacterized protein n=1 Tax=Haloarcula argentinensis TaxID=43776 RepID=A0ABU2F5M7_HALAR|nr:hypothetical protein [Haloarcula argentinensis]EMA26245.1 hypothetical protein C443_00807 [Haloarcula argentinensis DSM 12282]MDS0255426.1 hypothetical protein [Haloarcula argentinensis]
MRTQDAGHRAAAIAAIADREYRRAGDEYTRAGWRVLADPREGIEPFAADKKGWVGDGLQYLATSAVCYRVAGKDTRATRRGVEGVAVAKDLTNGLEHPVQHACLKEFVADFRAAGGLDGIESAYREAEAAYNDAGSAVDSPQAWGTTPLFEAAATLLQQVARGPANGEIAIPWEDLHGADPGDPGSFLAQRAVVKRQRFPSLIEQVIDDGFLATPRGTTEYDTDHHRCPHCGSTDVNWVAESVVCLRCSRPTAETS